VSDGSTAALTNGSATWELGVPTNANVTVSIANSTGQTVFTGSYDVSAGTIRPSPGTAKATTARSGRTASTS